MNSNQSLYLSGIFMSAVFLLVVLTPGGELSTLLLFGSAAAGPFLAIGYNLLGD